MADGARPSVAVTTTGIEIAEPKNTEHRYAFWDKLKLMFAPKTESEMSMEEALAEHGQKGELSFARRDMIERVIAFDSKLVVDVMIPRADIIAVERELVMNDLLTVFSEAGHSRLPVYRGELDDPIGMVHIRDLVEILANPEQTAEKGSAVLDTIVRKVLYVPPSMPITDLLLRMQANRIHMALVIDEFGGTDGLVTIEDLVEEIVGDIQDEHDDENAALLKVLSDSSWEANARLPLDELEQIINYAFDLGEDEVDTLGGLVFTLVGRVPSRGEVIAHPSGFEFEILEADPRRVRKIKLRKMPKKELVSSSRTITE